MNQSMGLLGRKLGATQVFAADGLVERVTVIQVGPCVVFQRRTTEQDGYWALVLGFEDKPDKLVKKPDLGPYVKDGSPLKEAGVNPKRMLREIRLPQEIVEKYEVGQTISAADVFESGQFVDVTGITKGRGFAGVFKRYRMRGGSRTHGTLPVRGSQSPTNVPASLASRYTCVLGNGTSATRFTVVGLHAKMKSTVCLTVSGVSPG